MSCFDLEQTDSKYQADQAKGEEDEEAAAAAAVQVEFSLNWLHSQKTKHIIYIYMYVCMYVCTYVRMYVSIHPSIYLFIYLI
jgi:hypothetical protein